MSLFGELLLLKLYCTYVAAGYVRKTHIELYGENTVQRNFWKIESRETGPLIAPLYNMIGVLQLD